MQKRFFVRERRFKRLQQRHRARHRRSSHGSTLLHRIPTVVARVPSRNGRNNLAARSTHLVVEQRGIRRRQRTVLVVIGKTRLSTRRGRRLYAQNITVRRRVERLWRLSVRAFVGGIWLSNAQPVVAGRRNQEAVGVGHRQRVLLHHRCGRASQRHVDYGGAVVGGVQNALRYLRRGSVAAGLQHLDPHNPRPRADPGHPQFVVGLRSRNARAVGTVRVVVHRIPVVVDEIPAVFVVHKTVLVVVDAVGSVDLGHVLPHLALQVFVEPIHACVNDGNHLGGVRFGGIRLHQTDDRIRLNGGQIPLLVVQRVVKIQGATNRRPVEIGLRIHHVFRTQGTQIVDQIEHTRPQRVRRQHVAVNVGQLGIPHKFPRVGGKTGVRRHGRNDAKNLLPLRNGVVRQHRVYSGNPDASLCTHTGLKGIGKAHDHLVGGPFLVNRLLSKNGCYGNRNSSKKKNPLTTHSGGNLI